MCLEDKNRNNVFEWYIDDSGHIHNIDSASVQAELDKILFELLFTYTSKGVLTSGSSSCGGSYIHTYSRFNNNAQANHVYTIRFQNLIPSLVIDNSGKPRWVFGFDQTNTQTLHKVLVCARFAGAILKSTIDGINAVPSSLVPTIQMHKVVAPSKQDKSVHLESSTAFWVDKPENGHHFFKRNYNYPDDGYGGQIGRAHV